MGSHFQITLGAFVLFVAGALAQTGTATRTIQVDVMYTGAGTVDASHKIYVALWESPDLTSGPPAAVQSVAATQGRATFSNVQKVPAYVSTAYDPTGGWDTQTPPPTGASLGMYSKKLPNPEPIDVAPGQTTTVAITFNDSVKVP